MLPLIVLSFVKYLRPNKLYFLYILNIIPHPLLIYLHSKYLATSSFYLNTQSKPYLLQPLILNLLLTFITDISIPIKFKVIIISKFRWKNIIFLFRTININLFIIFFFKNWNPYYKTLIIVHSLF